MANKHDDDDDGCPPRVNEAGWWPTGDSVPVDLDFSPVEKERAKDQIRVTADAIVQCAGYVVLVKRKYAPFKDMWALPGGHVDFKESTMDAAIRELQEETGLQSAPSGVSFLDYVDEPDRDPRGHYISFVFGVRTHIQNRGNDQKTTLRQIKSEMYAADDATDVRLVNISDIEHGLVDVAFDHAEIILKHRLAVV